jgi:hypothetical protein
MYIIYIYIYMFIYIIHIHAMQNADGVGDILAGGMGDIGAGGDISAGVDLPFQTPNSLLAVTSRCGGTSIRMLTYGDVHLTYADIC